MCESKSIPTWVCRPAAPCFATHQAHAGVSGLVEWPALSRLWQSMASSRSNSSAIAVTGHLESTG